MAANTKLSILDLSHVPTGSSSRQALDNTLQLAQKADQLGFHRFWMSEHHNSPGLASAAPEILVGHVAQATKHIRVGSGGIMLPNHASLKVAETFRLLEALHPGRIDLGLGRAPGTDMLTAQALRRSSTARDTFPDQMGELICFLNDHFPEGHPLQSIRAIPQDIPSPQLWLLSSSGYGAAMAAHLGLGMAFAHHIHPDPLVPSMKMYREDFKASAQFQKPQSILTVAAVCAPTQAEAEALASSFDLARLLLEQGKRGKFPSVAEAEAYPYEAGEEQRVRENRKRFFVGNPDTLKTELTDLARQAGAEEIMILTMVHDHAARMRSYELLAETFKLIRRPE